MSSTKNVIKMILASTINQIAIVLAGLVIPPLIISKYGSSVNGLVNSTKQILSYFSVFSVGLGAAAQVELYSPLAKRNTLKVNEIMSELSFFFNKISVLLSCLVGILAFVLPIISNDGIEKETIIFIVLICGIGSIVEFVVLTKYSILLIADQKQYIISNVSTQCTILNVILSAVLIYFDTSIICVQLAATFTYTVRMCLIIYKVKKSYPQLDLQCRAPEKSIHNQRDALLYKLTDIIINYFPMTVVMLVCGFEDVSVYTVYNLVFAAIVMIISIFSNGFASVFGKQIVERKFKSLHDTYLGYNFAIRTISFWLYSSACVLIVPFVSVYINNRDGVNYLLPSIGICFSLNGLFRAIRIPSITIIDSIGSYRENLIFNYIEAIMNVVLSTYLTLKLGMVGVLIGGLVSAMFRSILFIIKVDTEILHISIIGDIVRLIINFMLGCTICFLFKELTVDNIKDWIIKATYIAVLNGVIFATSNVLMDKSAFKELLKHLKHLKGLIRHN